MDFSVWFLGFSLSHSHMVVSVHLLPLSAFLELGQFAAVEDLIFFLKVSLSIAVVLLGEGEVSFPILQPVFLIHGAFQKS